MARDIESLRQEIDHIDRNILELIKKRTDTASQIGLLKMSTTLPLRNFDREKICIENARAIAAELGLSTQLAEDIQLKLIQASLTSQEQDRVRFAKAGNAKRAVVIGGAGKMGNWFAHFLTSQGIDVDVYDPKANPAFDPVKRFEDIASYDLIVVAAPLHESNQVLLALSRLRPKGLVFDVASLKGPLKEGLIAVATAEIKATSMHPMFGPDTKLLSGRHVIIVDLGNPKANQEAAQLFAPTTATLVQMDAEQHDRSMAFLLGLSHAVNIVFSDVLAKSGESAPWLAGLSSTTFDAQIAVASRVARENPKLYYEIQASNPFGLLSLQMLAQATQELHDIVKTQDEKRFTALMEAGARYYQNHDKGHRP